MGAPGYMAPPWFRGAAVDRYAMGILAIDLFVPIAPVIRWSPGKMDEVLELVERYFPVPSDYRARVHRNLAAPTGPTDATAAAWPEMAAPGESVPQPSWTALSTSGAARNQLAGAADRLAAAVLATATPHRSDRLYPGDAVQFMEPAGGLAFLYGAAGVLWALGHSDTEIPDEHVDWFRNVVRTTSSNGSASVTDCAASRSACTPRGRSGRRTTPWRRRSGSAGSLRRPGCPTDCPASA